MSLTLIRKHVTTALSGDISAADAATSTTAISVHNNSKDTENLGEVQHKLNKKRYDSNRLSTQAA